MLSYIWGGIIVLSTAVGLAKGRGEALSTAIFQGASSGITLVITILGISAFWCGMMEIAKRSGAVEGFSKICRPFVRLLFKNVKKNSDAEGAICANIAANVIGVSNAATPLGLRAMELLSKGAAPGEASDDMATLVLINTASVQILPSTVVALRALAGSVSPYKILPMVWIASVATLTVGIVALRLFRRNKKW